MALTDIILNKGEVVVTLSGSTLGITANGVALNFGTVQLINDLCDTVSVGNQVWIDIDGAIPFMIVSGTVFYKITEDKVFGKETSAP